MKFYKFIYWKKRKCYLTVTLSYFKYFKNRCGSKLILQTKKQQFKDLLLQTAITALFTHCSSAFSSISPWSRISFASLSTSWESPSAWLSGSLRIGEKHFLMNSLIKKNRRIRMVGEKKEPTLLKENINLAWQQTFFITRGLYSLKWLTSSLLKIKIKNKNQKAKWVARFLL